MKESINITQYAGELGNLYTPILLNKKQQST